MCSVFSLTRMRVYERETVCFEISIWLTERRVQFVPYFLFLVSFACSAGRCPPAPSFVYSSPDSLSAEPGGILIYRCVLGYMWPSREHTLSVKCENGIWNLTDGECTGEHLM